MLLGITFVLVIGSKSSKVYLRQADVDKWPLVLAADMCRWAVKLHPSPYIIKQVILVRHIVIMATDKPQLQVGLVATANPKTFPLSLCFTFWHSFYYFE